MVCGKLEQGLVFSGAETEVSAVRESKASSLEQACPPLPEGQERWEEANHGGPGLSLLGNSLQFLPSISPPLPPQLLPCLGLKMGLLLSKLSVPTRPWGLEAEGDYAPPSYRGHRHSSTSHDLFGVCPPFVVNSFEHHRQKGLGSFPYLRDGNLALFKSHSQGT